MDIGRWVFGSTSNWMKGHGFSFSGLLIGWMVLDLTHDLLEGFGLDA